ncbi:hypothetical protein BDV96DRAFT_598227 [Lophiotrema nucula]|uniref:Uncharacterized protein n=1 Tax=Lophiotrema nucula TaxID=690887 RepID=A0A6A5ZEE7_9PLEO|nr:hypothetical protein BDV96DRAFT_598227 [Lophiotrema nucula]
MSPIIPLPPHFRAMKHQSELPEPFLSQLAADPNPSPIVQLYNNLPEMEQNQVRDTINRVKQLYERFPLSREPPLYLPHPEIQNWGIEMLSTLSHLCMIGHSKGLNLEQVEARIFTARMHIEGFLARNMPAASLPLPHSFHTYKVREVRLAIYNLIIRAEYEACKTAFEQLDIVLENHPILKHIDALQVEALSREFSTMLHQGLCVYEERKHRLMKGNSIFRGLVERGRALEWRDVFRADLVEGGKDENSDLENSMGALGLGAQ